MSNQGQTAGGIPGGPPGMTRREYIAERNAKLALSEKQGEFLDQWLLTLSGGGLGLTLTFLHDHGTVTLALPLAIAGMALLVATLLFALVSLAFSQRSISNHIDALDGWCLAHFHRGHKSEARLWQNAWAGATLWLNRLAIGACISGIIFVSVFVVKNLPTQPEKGSETMQSTGNNQKPQSAPADRIERGAVIKPPPATATQPAQPAQRSEKK